VPEIVVFGFSDSTTADQVIPEVEAMQRENLLSLADWARVIRRPDGKLDVRQGNSTTGAGAAGGALWGMLFGLIFLMPIAGLAIGAATGALAGKLADYGIDDKFIKDLGQQIQPGTSALFLYVVAATNDKVIERLRPYNPTLLRTSLSAEAETQLREALLPAQTPA
jgi:uncharacterized membrane protein